MRESRYQLQLIKKLEDLFPGCYIRKTDPRDIQGLPDLTIFYHDRWAMLEVKTSAKSAKEPNQEYHVDRMNELSFAAFIYPENEKEVLNELQRSFGSVRKARVSKS